MDKFEHGFGTQLGAVLLWRRVPSGSLMLAAWSHQTTAAAGNKLGKFEKEKGPFWILQLPPNNSCRNSEGALGSFCG